MPARLRAHSIAVVDPAHAAHEVTRAALDDAPRGRPLLLAVARWGAHPGLRPSPWVLGGIASAVKQSGLGATAVHLGERGVADPVTAQLSAAGIDRVELDRAEAIAVRSPGSRRSLRVPRDWLGNTLCLVLPFVHHQRPATPRPTWHGPIGTALVELTTSWGGTWARDPVERAARCVAELFGHVSVVIDASWWAPLSSTDQGAPMLLAPERTLGLRLASPLTGETAIDPGLADRWLGMQLGLPLRRRSTDGPRVVGPAAQVPWPKLPRASAPARPARRSTVGLASQAIDALWRRAEQPGGTAYRTAPCRARLAGVAMGRVPARGRADVSTLLRRTLYAVIAGILLYVAALLYFDVEPLRRTLVDYPWWVFAVALALSSGNYLLRFVKWELSLHWLRVRHDAPELTRGRSLLIYLAGLSMSVTPGKVGEVLRSMLLHASNGIPFTRTAPVVVADRLTDLIALVLLAAIGVAERPEYLPVLVLTVVLVVLGVVVLGSPRLLGGMLDRLARVQRLKGLVAKARPLVDSSVILMRPGPMAWLSLLSVAGWGLECIGFWLIVGGFSGVDPSLRTCTLLWSAGTLVGALSFIPGGLGATEGSLLVATTKLVGGATSAISMAASLLGRLATLWYGELVGGIALALFLRDPAVRARAMNTDGDDTQSDPSTEPPSS